LELVDGSAVEGVIMDLFHKGKAECLRLDDGSEIRLDRIHRMSIVDR